MIVKKWWMLVLLVAGASALAKNPVGEQPQGFSIDRPSISEKAIGDRLAVLVTDRVFGAGVCRQHPVEESMNRNGVAIYTPPAGVTGPDAWTYIYPIFHSRVDARRGPGSRIYADDYWWAMIQLIDELRRARRSATAKDLAVCIGKGLDDSSFRWDYRQTADDESTVTGLLAEAVIAAWMRVKYD